jgi:hypothetical protein
MNAEASQYCDIHHIMFDPFDEREKKVGPLTVTYDRETEPYFSLSTYLNHQHYSLERLKEKHRFALGSDKEELACFMVLVSVIGDMILTCNKHLISDISLAENHFNQLNSEYQQKKQDLEQALNGCKIQKEETLQFWRNKLSVEAKNFVPFSTKEKRAHHLKAIVNGASLACKPFVMEENCLKKRLRKLEDKVVELHQIEEVINAAKVELTSHTAINEFLHEITENKPPAVVNKDKEETM